MPSIRWERWEWIDDIIVGTIAGALLGLVGHYVLPGSPPLLISTIGGSILGFLEGVLEKPLRWMLGAGRHQALSTASEEVAARELPSGELRSIDMLPAKERDHVR